MKNILLCLIVFFSCHLSAQVPSYVPSDGLVGYWPFDGNANDESGNGNNGTVNGATLTTDRFGNANSAYAFDGIDDYITGNSTNLSAASTNKLTIASWINVNQLATAPAASKVFTHTNNATNEIQQYALSINSNGSIYFLAGNGEFENNGPNLSPTGQIQSNTWVHLAVVVSIDSVKLYLNGNVVMSKPENDNFPINPVDLFVFSSFTNTTFNKLFNGSIDDTGIWNRALTEQEITDLYNAELSTPCDATVDLGPDTLGLCAGDSILLDAGAGYDNYDWSTGDTSQTIYASNSGSYSVTVGDGVGVDNDYSMSFDGAGNQDINIPESASINSINDKLTIMAWVKTLGDLNGENPRIIDRSEGNGGGTDRWFLTHTSSNILQFGVGQGATQTVTGSSPLTIGEWIAVAAVYDAGGVTLYENGTPDGSGNISISDLSHVENVAMSIGSVNGDNSFWNGSLDDIHIWNTALTQSEIQQYMSCPPTGNETGLVGYWDFEEGSGTTALDQTSNGNDGTINGATYSTDVPAQTCLSCTATDSVYVDVLNAQIVQNDTSICFGDSVELSILSDSIIFPGNFSAFDYMGCNEGNYYYFSQYTTSWTNAFNDCQQFGGHILTINNQEEQNFIESIATFSPALHLGIEKNNTSQWITGEPVVFSNWETSNFNQCCYGEFLWNDGTWGFDPNTSQHRICMEIETNGLCPLTSDILWSTGDTTATITVSPSQTTTYSLTVDNGTTVCTDSVTVTVNAASVDLGADTLSLCAGDSVLLDAGAGFDSYSWSTGETTQSIYTNTSGTYSATVGQGDAVVNDYSMSFDGVDDYVEVNVNYAPTTSSDFSIALWTKPGSGGTTVSKYDNLNAPNSNFFIQLDGSNGSGVISGDGTNTVSFSIPQLNTWTYISAVFNANGNVSIFVNGTLQSTGNLNLNSLISSTPMTFGRVSGPSPGYFDGRTDNVSIWNTALTQSQIQQYMNCPPTGDEAGLVGYWNFEEGSGTTAFDLTANGNHGTINGATYETDTPEQICNACSATDSIVVSILDATITASSESVCFGDSVELSVVSNGAIEECNLSGSLVNGLVGYWPFCGNANDESGNGNDGAVNGATLTTDRFGTSNSAYNFDDNNNQYIEVGETNSLNNCQKMSVSFWFNISGNNSRSHFINKTEVPSAGITENKQFIVSLNSTGIYFYYDANNYFQTNIIPDFNQWNQLTVTYDYGTINTLDQCQFFLNGILIDTFPTQAILAETNFNMRFGSYADQSSNTVAGKIDDIGVWNRVLSESEIQQLYSGGGSTYSWSTGSTETSITVAPTETTTYTVTVDDGNGTCTDDVEIEVNQTTSYTDITACESYEWNGNTYTQSGTYLFSDGSNNSNSLEFNSSSNISVDPYVDCGDVLDMSESFSIGGWVYNEAGTPESCVLSKRQQSSSGPPYFGYNLSYENNLGRFAFGIQENSLAGGDIVYAPANTNEWVHVVGVFHSGASISIYINGLFINSQSTSFSSLTNNSAPFRIGCLGIQAYASWNGKLDEIFIYDKALTNAEVSNIYNCNMLDDNLQGHWRFEEGSGTTAFDLTSNGNNGTINGAIYSTDVPTQSCPLTNVNGCDSTAVLSLTINQGDTSYTDITACGGYKWNGTDYTASGVYTFETLNANGCDSIATLDLTINNVSDLTTTIAGVTISANNMEATYQWLDCDNGFAIISGENGQSYTPVLNGNYAIELTENGCVDTTACIAITSVGILENSFGNDFVVYPNPTNGNFSVDLGANHGNVKIRITDANGRLIQSSEFSSAQILDLNISEASGVYLLTVESSYQRAVIRLVKQ